MKANEHLNHAKHPVSRIILGLILIGAVVSTGVGCRLCCDDEDMAYPAYGGVWERTNRDSGRVGSVFDAGGAQVANLSPRDSVENAEDQRSRILPSNEGEGDERSETPEEEAPKPKADSETDQEFQERLKQFQEERLKKFEQEKMLNAKIIPGTPTPPDLRY